MRSHGIKGGLNMDQSEIKKEVQTILWLLPMFCMPIIILRDVPSMIIFGGTTIFLFLYLLGANKHLVWLSGQHIGPKGDVYEEGYHWIWCDFSQIVPSEREYPLSWGKIFIKIKKCNGSVENTLEKLNKLNLLEEYVQDMFDEYGYKGHNLDLWLLEDILASFFSSPNISSFFEFKGITELRNPVEGEKEEKKTILQEKTFKNVA